VRHDEQPRVAIGPGRQGDVIHRLRLGVTWAGASESDSLGQGTNVSYRLKKSAHNCPFPIFRHVTPSVLAYAESLF
jgi:hypothetical protein